MPRGRPRDGFCGTLGIHFIPAIAIEPPTYAGMAMIRPCFSSVSMSSDQWSADFCGAIVSPRWCSTSVSSIVARQASMSRPPAATTSSCERKRNSADATVRDPTPSRPRAGRQAPSHPRALRCVRCTVAPVLSRAMADAQVKPSANQILADWRSQGIRFVRFELPDMHGTSRSKLVPIESAPDYAEGGLNMYGGAGVLDSRSDVVGGTLYNEEVAYGDQRLIPDPATAAIVPWAEATGRFVCDSVWDDGSPLAALPRHVFRRALDRCRAAGYDPVLGFEPEFYLLDAETKGPLFEGYHIFNTVRNTYVPFVQDLVEQLQEFGIEIITANCEYAGSQWEINYTPGVGLEGPDRTFTFKNAVKELAHLSGYCATFMSKPFSGSAGSGMHTHVSLLDGDGRNVMADESDPEGISPLCRSFVAGQLRHASSSYALLAPTLNCLKRRRPHTFSPSNVSWGLEDRSALVRIKGGSIASRHVEHRAPTALANPYLAGAVILGAGLIGIEEGLELEPAASRPAEEDGSKAPLPLSLHESLAALEGDDQLRDVLGEEFVTAYTVMRRHELQRFDDHVTDWEFQEYVEVY